MDSRTISFDQSKYHSLDEMYKDVSDLTRILVTNDYEVLFRYEDCGIYVLEYCYSRDARLGTDCFETLTDDEQAMLQEYRFNKTDDPDE